MGLRIEGLDEKIVVPDREVDGDGVSKTVWYENPITEEDAERINNQAGLMLETAKSMKTEDAMAALAMGSRKPTESTEGKPWTLRQAVVSSMYSNTYRDAVKDKNGPKPERPEDVAEMARIGHAFTHAPLFGFVELDTDQIKLLRRKAVELPLPTYIYGVLIMTLDEVEGKAKKNKIEYGESNGRQDDAGKTPEDAKV